MQNRVKILTAFAGIVSTLALNSCQKDDQDLKFDETKTITKYTRDKTSGTRDGFFTAIGFKDAVENDSLLPNAIKATDNGNMISCLNNDEYGIGYISLASAAQSDLNILKYENVIPTEEAVIDGSYKLSRNFNYVTKVKDDCSETEWNLVQGFLLFMQSQEGQGIIKSKDGILVNQLSSAKKWKDLLDLEENKNIKILCETPCDKDKRIEIKFGGSTSVEKIAEALTKAFESYCPTFKPVHNHTGSSAAYQGTQGKEKNGINSMHVGFLSRELKQDSEKAAEDSYGLICKDGIVVAVNKKNTYVDNITANQLKEIYSSANLKWDYLSASATYE